MSELKTKATDANVEDFIHSVEPEQRRQDAVALLELFGRVTGEQARMWGSSMVGFGQYHYKSQRSRQEGDWPLVAFSPRKQSLTLYIMTGFDGTEALLQRLGKHTTSVGCLYIKRLSDVDLEVLEQIVRQAFLDMKRQHAPDA